MFLWVIFCSKKLKNDWPDLSWRLYKPTMFLWVIFSSKKLKNDWLDLSWWLYKSFSGHMQGIGGRVFFSSMSPLCGLETQHISVGSPRYIYYPLPTIRGARTIYPFDPTTRRVWPWWFPTDNIRYTCIARMRFGNQIMNKYHTIACKFWVIYAWCRCLFNSYSSSHPKSISFIKKIYFKIHGIVHCKA